LEDNDRAKTLKYQKSIQDLNGKITHLKMDFNQTVEHYEKLQNDFEFLKKMSDHQNNKIKDL